MSLAVSPASLISADISGIGRRRHLELTLPTIADIPTPSDCLVDSRKYMLCHLIVHFVYLIPYLLVYLVPVVVFHVLLLHRILIFTATIPSWPPVTMASYSPNMPTGFHSSTQSTADHWRSNPFGDALTFRVTGPTSLPSHNRQAWSRSNTGPDLEISTSTSSISCTASNAAISPPHSNSHINTVKIATPQRSRQASPSAQRSISANNSPARKPVASSRPKVSLVIPKPSNAIVIVDNTDDIPPAVPPKSPGMALSATNPTVLRQQHYARLRKQTTFPPSASSPIISSPIIGSPFNVTPNIGGSTIGISHINTPTGYSLTHANTYTSAPSFNVDLLTPSPSRSAIELSRPSRSNSPNCGPMNKILAQSQLVHGRSTSETSALDRGRQNTRQIPHNRSQSDVSSLTTPLYTTKPAISRPIIDEELPSGFCNREAITRYTDLERDSLRVDAVMRAEQFKILTKRDVNTLSKVSHQETMKKFRSEAERNSPWNRMPN